jgi:molecular chaperone Hsp33
MEFIMNNSASNQSAFQSDTLQRFIFDNAAVRGEWVHLSETWQNVLILRKYPKAIKCLLGEMMAAVALLTATVKIKGRLVLQLKSAGPVTLMMVECTSDNTLRAFAQWQGKVKEDASLTEITGAGALAITIDVAGAKQPYQGVVNLQGESLAGVLEAYFKQSEQLETRIWLAADSQSVAGLFLQQLPSESQDKEADEEHWSRLSQLANTISKAELLGLGVGTLLHRLFHEEQCRLLSATELCFSCNCSREKVAESIGLLGKDDANNVLQERGHIEVTCEFCNKHYQFDEMDLAEIFSYFNEDENDKKTVH